MLLAEKDMKDYQQKLFVKIVDKLDEGDYRRNPNLFNVASEVIREDEKEDKYYYLRQQLLISIDTFLKGLTSINKLIQFNIQEFISVEETSDIEREILLNWDNRVNILNSYFTNYLQAKKKKLMLEVAQITELQHLHMRSTFSEEKMLTQDGLIVKVSTVIIEKETDSLNTAISSGWSRNPFTEGTSYYYDYQRKHDPCNFSIRPNVPKRF